MNGLGPRLLMVALFGLASGCGGSSGSGLPKERVALEEIADLYRSYSADHGKPPQKLSDLQVLRPVGPTGVTALESGAVVLSYGVPMTDTNEGAAVTPSEDVLAYEKKVPDEGGQVLLLDRRIRTMTVDEFKAAKKASK